MNGSGIVCPTPRAMGSYRTAVGRTFVTSDLKSEPCGVRLAVGGGVIDAGGRGATCGR